MENIMALQSQYTNAGGVKVISQNVLAHGDYTGTTPNGFISRRVLTLPGYCNKTRVGSQCIETGRSLGYITEDAKVFGVEREAELVKPIRDHARKKGINLELVHVDLNGFVPPDNLDVAILDLMCMPNHWIGETIVNNILPKMAPRAGIGINLNVQRMNSHTVIDQTDSFRAELRANQDDYLGVGKWDRDQPQDINWMKTRSLRNPPKRRELAKSIPTSQDGTGNPSLLAFVSIHQYMKHTDMKYAGCYLYSGSGNTQHMLSLRYERDDRPAFL